MLDFVINFYIFFLVSLLTLALAVNDSGLLLMIALFLAPVGIVVIAVQRKLRKKSVEAKTKALAKVLKDAANILDAGTAQIPLYDAWLSNEMAIVHEGLRDSFLSAIARLLFEAKVVFSENTVYERWQGIEPHENDFDPVKLIRFKTMTLASAVRRRDYVLSFEVLGDMAIYALLNLQGVEKPIPLSMNEFVDRVRTINDFVRDKQVLDAQDSYRALRQRLADSISINDDREEKHWEAIVLYWLNIQLQSVAHHPYHARPRPRWLWADPSTILSKQIQVALASLTAKDYATLSEIIYESFDWQRRTPRFII